MKKFRFVLPFLALVIVVAASAFTVVNNAEPTLIESRYHFMESTAQNIYNASTWEPADPTYPSCNGFGLPCVITITGDLQEFLDDAEANGGLADIEQVAESFKQ